MEEKLFEKNQTLFKHNYLDTDYVDNLRMFPIDKASELELSIAELSLLDSLEIVEES